MRSDRAWSAASRLASAGSQFHGGRCAPPGPRAGNIGEMVHRPVRGGRAEAARSPLERSHAPSIGQSAERCSGPFSGSGLTSIRLRNSTVV
jgi:hypothetical protein